MWHKPPLPQNHDELLQTMFNCNFATLFLTRQQNPYQTNYKPETLILNTYNQITINDSLRHCLQSTPATTPTTPQTEKSTAICHKIIKKRFWLVFVTLFLARWETFTNQIRDRSIPLDTEGSQNTGRRVGGGDCEGAAGSLASTCPISSTGGVVAALNVVF